jgi:hypothetical protein
VEVVVGAEIPSEIWVDGDGYVRRLFFEYDMVELLSGSGSGLDSRGIDEFVAGSTVDYFNYGDETIHCPPSRRTSPRPTARCWSRVGATDPTSRSAWPSSARAGAAVRRICRCTACSRARLLPRVPSLALPTSGRRNEVFR